MSNIYTSVDQLVGRTPLLELSHIEKIYGLEARILAKLEYLNPAGSVKDRGQRLSNRHCYARNDEYRAAAIDESIWCGAGAYGWSQGDEWGD